MTTIVYKNGILCADSRGYGGGRPPVGHKCKISRIDGDGPYSGFWIGTSSIIVGFGESMTAWMRNGADPAQFPNPGDMGFSTLGIAPDGRVFLWDGKMIASGPLEPEKNAGGFAIGSGLEYAFAAMACGKNAVQAVRIASKFDVWSEPPFHYVDVLKAPFNLQTLSK